MAIDSAAKRKSVAATGGSFFVGPVVVPDSSISLFDRQAIGFGYGGIEAGEVATVAGFILVRNATLKTGRATATLNTGRATATLVS